MGKSLSPDSRLINFRANPEDIERWKEDAYKARMPLSRWIRHCLDNAAKGDEPWAPQPVPAVAPKVDTAPLLTTLAEELTKAKEKSSTQCERRLPKGAFCKACGRIHK